VRRREFITLLGGALVCSGKIYAQQSVSARLPIIGVIAPSSFTASEGLRHGLRELGYVEGESLRLEYRWADGPHEQYASVASELIGLGAAVIVTYGTPAALAAKTATTTIPIVMAAIGDPVGSGIVTSLARPGGNITGFTSIVSDLEVKRLEILKEVIPTLLRVGLLGNPKNPAVVPAVAAVRRAAAEMGLTVDEAEVRETRDFDRAFTAWRQNLPDAALVLADPLLLNNASEILRFMADVQLPAVYSHREFTVSGGLMSYGPNYWELFRRAAGYVDKILKGAKPGDLPVQQPERFALLLNLRTANTLRLAIPPMVLARADEVIE
jgi:putative tryptophan/tyrosine transport system substrate-binding protein